MDTLIDYCNRLILGKADPKSNRSHRLQGEQQQFNALVYGKSEAETMEFPMRHGAFPFQLYNII